MSRFTLIDKSCAHFFEKERLSSLYDLEEGKHAVGVRECAVGVGEGVVWVWKGGMQWEWAGSLQQRWEDFLIFGGGDFIFGQKIRKMFAGFRPLYRHYRKPSTHTQRPSFLLRVKVNLDNIHTLLCVYADQSNIARHACIVSVSVYR